MAVLETLVILLTTLYTVRATTQNACPISTCGSLNIHYPFILEDAQTVANNNRPYINLACTYTAIHGIAGVELPGAGRFYVGNIDYFKSLLRLYDPESCLMAQLMHDLDLLSSPLKALGYENYTFYACPSEAYIVSKYVYPIHCLSNTTDSTVATAFLLSDYMLEWGCRVIRSQVLPVFVKDHQFVLSGVNGDLYLTRNARGYIACDNQLEPPLSGGDESKGKPLSPSRFFILIMLMIIIFIVGQLITPRNRAGGTNVSSSNGQPMSAAAPPQASVADRQPVSAPPPTDDVRGMDESNINTCTELVVLRTNPGPDWNTCAICLEGYCPQQHVRTIPKCHHSFHAVCIQQWLRKNTTCPVCRTVLSDNIDS